MKKLLLLVSVLAVLSIMFVGCGKKNIETPQPTQSTNIDSPIVGVWTHQDVPEMSYYKTWTLSFKKDGTYTTSCDKKEMTDIYGEKGTFALTDNSITFLKEDKSKSRTETFEIVKENGEEKLAFKDSTGKNKSSAISGGKTYDLIFNKQK